jgi:hypothetical protein
MARIKIGNVRTPIDYLKQYFAPAGFGLGASGKMLKNTDDLNTIWQSGWYRWGDSVPANAPVFLTSNKYSYMRVDGTDEKTFTQTAYSVFGDAKGIFMTRNITENVVDEWAFVNPPMKVGVEYRTTEWYKSKPVYRKIVAYNLPASTNTDFSVPHGISNFDTLVRQTASVGAGIPLPYTHSGNTTSVKEMDATNVKVSNTGQSWDSSYTWNFYLYYTKTTD